MPNLSSALKLVSTPIDPICTCELGLISAPASNLIPLAPGTPCPQPRHAEGIWKGLVSRLTQQVEVWAHVSQILMQPSLNLGFASILGHLDTTHIATWGHMTPTNHTLTPESYFFLTYQPQPRMTRLSRSFRPACQCTIKDGDACLSHSRQDDHEGCAYARPAEQCAAPELS